MQYFTIEELCYSETALRMGLKNTPSALIRDRLRTLIETLLDPLREEWAAQCSAQSWGNPAILVTSGYRSAELNRAVGGAATSAHTLGWAADLKPRNGRLHDFKNCCRSFLATRSFDQLISESEDATGTPRWMHIGLYDRLDRQRNELLTMRNSRYLPMTDGALSPISVPSGVTK